MYIEEIKRGLRGEIKKRENEQYCTCETNIRQMCKDVLAKIEEQESMLAEKDKELRHHKYMRYIDIAEWCSCKSEYFDQYSRHTDYIPSIEKYKRKRNHYADRCNKLLLLAEKLKPNNSTAQ